jgi:hypothetical protein
MTPDEYRATCARLGLSLNAASRLLGVNERTSRRWALGEIDIPKPVQLALRLMDDRLERGLPLLPEAVR